MSLTIFIIWLSSNRRNFLYRVSFWLFQSLGFKWWI